MRFFNQQSISSKLFVVLLLPIITLLFFASITVLEKRQQLQNTQNALHFTYIAQKFVAVVYQLQKERGLSSGAVGNRGKVYQASLAQQRIQTDTAIKKLSPLFIEVPGYLTEENFDKFRRLNNEFTKLSSIRIKIDQPTDEDFFDFYSHIISDVLNVVSILQLLFIESEQKDIASSYLDIVWLEEYSGQERGALNGVFAAQHFNADQFNTISSYIASQHAALRHFFNTATVEHQIQMRKALNDSSSNEVEHYREIVFNRVQRNDALNGLKILIGYGGFIHDFKNYVIRGNGKFDDQIKQQFKKISSQIKAYRLLPNISNEEEKSLKAIKKTLQKYLDHLPTIAAMKAKNSSIDEIDQAVKVDDQFALNGIRLLRQNITDYDPDHWWKQASRRLDLIHQVSSLIARDLIQVSQQRKYQNQQLLYLYIVITVFIILLSCFIGFKLRSRLVNEIKYIADTMQDSQKTQQFHELLTVTGNDEIAEMANAFNNLIIERARAEEKLRLSAQVFSAAHEGIIITDVEASIIDTNPSFCEITGFSREEVIGQNPSILSSGKQSPVFYAEMWQSLNEHGHWQGEIWNRKKDGMLYAELLTISSILDDDDNTCHYVGIFSDITHSKKQQETLEQMAHYDVLTQLPNRVLLTDRFILALAHSKRQETVLAVCVLDLDNFKPINDQCGHETGDQLLIEVAKRIEANIRDEDTVSRQGGDEFALLLGDIESFSQCEKTLKRIIESLAQPYVIDEQSLSISASIGVSLYPMDNSDLDTLLRHADQAMYQAKLAGKNRYSLFNIKQDKIIIEKQIKLKGIRKALLNNELCLYYQPKVNMATGKVFGAEALIRWNHPEKGLIPPLEFLPIIEETELEIQIGNWVIYEALKQLDNWKMQGIELEVSVNISSYHLQSPSFVSDLEKTMALFPKVHSKKLQLEILESSALGDIQSITGIIKTCIEALGVNIALDDFGTGYSSLTHLRNLPVQTIKIDQTFVRDILDDPNDHAIIDGVIGLADSFKREVIAEGVETTEHGLMLLIMGCNEAQGYGIARPMPVLDIPDWLTNYTPNQEWVTCANKVLTKKESTLKLLRLTLAQWQKSFKNHIQCLPGEIEQWPILKRTKCHSGIWIKRAKQEELFEESWLIKLDETHNTMHDMADDLFKKYQNGEVNTARDGLKDIQLVFEKMSNLLGQCE